MQQPAPQPAYKDLPDADLAARIAAGDRLALEHLMRRHNQTLYRTARSILKDDAEAEDAVQEAYVLAYRAMDKFRGDAKLSTWLIRIAVNVSIRRARKARIIIGFRRRARGGGIAARAQNPSFPRRGNKFSTVW